MTMAAKRKYDGIKGLGFVMALASFAWVFFYLTPPDFEVSFPSSLTPAEQRYLLSLKKKHSGVSRTLTEAEARCVIKNACSFIERVNGTKEIYDTPAARELLFGTACTESGLRPRFQDKNGTAIGLFQVEYATFLDLWNRAIKTKYPKLYKEIKKNYAGEDKQIRFEDLQLSDELCAVFARMKYAQAKSHIPPAADLEAQARYYKKYYNTELGKASHKSYLKRRAEVLEREK